MKPVWAKRTGTGLAPSFQAYSESTQDDAPYLVHDVVGSIAHVLGLHHVGLLEQVHAEALVEGLQGIAAQADQGTFSLDPALEDVHMNIEAALAPLGEAADRLHTGRSRNDQVATCTVLYARAGVLDLATAAGSVATALAALAEAHATTPWVARTHGQPAQPATLGFLLLAHAFRFQDLQQDLLAVHDRLGESPLGCGAVAGSTLPVDPTFTASLLGLRPPRNALLATGAKDAVRATVQACAEAGTLAASLAEDLLGLFHDGALALPSGYTTGSSLMPQKRNPDVLELVRGHGRALQGPVAAVTAVTQGLGLGYQRDLQTVKPALSEALTTASATLKLLAEAVAGARIDTAAAQKALQAPGITATDAAEALVLNGHPFRQAYGLMAQAAAAVEEGHDWPEAIEGLGLDGDDEADVLAALLPDPASRDTLGGPAPSQVKAALEAFHAVQQSRQAALQVAHQAAPHARLLGTSPEALVKEAAP